MISFLLSMFGSMDRTNDIGAFALINLNLLTTETHGVTRHHFKHHTDVSKAIPGGLVRAQALSQGLLARFFA